ncbi:MAG: M15 family metallopeptidase [Bradymonadia bacterium]
MSPAVLGILSTAMLLGASAQAGGEPAVSLGDQLVVVITDDWSAHQGRLQRFERYEGPWKAVGASVPVVVGRKGLGWGRGVLPEREDQQGPRKREGDGKAPAGIFALGEAMGYAAEPPQGATLKYTPSTGQARCVDDPKAAQYNQLVDAPTGKPPWRSAEVLKRRDHLYQLLVTVDHNGLLSGSPTPGDGSCIFLHVWRSAKKGTAGCTAMKASALKTIVTWLRPSAKPLLVQMPQAVYQQHQQRLGLPVVAGTGLVDATTVVPSLQVELKYATTDNFLGKAVYAGKLDQCLMQRDAAEMLASAAAHLKTRAPELRLHAYDCARPRSVQRQMWAVVKGTPQAPYVANPDKGAGSIHNYGCAIDLTLADAEGRDIDMGTKFDHFGPEAEPRREVPLRIKGKLTAEQLGNRLLLREVMVRAGFLPLDNEWWHFNCATPQETRRRYSIIE